MVSNSGIIHLDELREYAEEEEKALVRYEQELEERRGKLNEIKSSIAVLEDFSRQKAVDALIASPKKQLTLIDAVNDSLVVFGGAEFTVRDVEAELKERNVFIEGQYPRNQLATILATLENRGCIERTLRGRGSQRHRFKQRNVGEEEK